MAEATYVEPMLASLATSPGRTGVPGAGGRGAGGPGSVALGSGVQGPLAHLADRYLLEWKLDGLRCIGVRNGAAVDLYSRNHLSFNRRFPKLLTAVAALPATDFTIDGEIIGLVGGRPDFAALAQGTVDAVEYWVFDLVHLLGHDVRPLPIEERKALLAKLIPVEGPVRLTPPIGPALVGPVARDTDVGSGSRGGEGPDGNGQGSAATLFTRACADGWEGLVAKRRGSPYRSGRSTDWLKLKCVCRQEMVIGGWTPPKGSRRGIGALLVGYYEAGALVYAGKVGTGFTSSFLEELYAQLSAIEQGWCPFSGQPKERPVRWCRPVLVAEVAFSNWTADGRLRHPSFVGLRQDKEPSLVVREGPVPEARARR